MKTIEFTHEYYKLKEQEFTTIRGKTSINKYKVGECVKIILKADVIGTAEVVRLEKTEIGKIPLGILKRDGEFPGFEINSHRDFIGLINSLRRFNKLKNADEEVTIITLKRVQS